MGIMPRYNSLSLFWKIYFGFLYVVLIVFAGSTIYLLLTGGGTDSGIADVYAIQYLITFVIFVVFSALLYKLGGQLSLARPLLASIVVIGTVGTTGAYIFNSYVNNQYETNYRPLTRIESLELIKSCHVSSVVVGSPRYNDIQLNTTDGKYKTTERFSSDEYEQELQSTLASINC